MPHAIPLTHATQPHLSLENILGGSRALRDGGQTAPLPRPPQAQALPAQPPHTQPAPRLAP